MSTVAHSPEVVSVEEFLAGEWRSERKQDYLGGALYTIPDASGAHNVIAVNLIGLLHPQLRGKPCQQFGSDMKVRLQNLGDTYFYYPDAMVACDPTDSGHGWRDRPTVLFEIISDETRRVDEREKRFVYLQIPSLQAYVRIEQSSPEAVVERRTNAWHGEKYTGLDAVLELPEIGVRLALAELFERLTF